MRAFTKKLVLVLLTLSPVALLGQQFTFSIQQLDPGNPLEFTVLFIPDFTATTVDLTASTITFSIPDDVGLIPMVNSGINGGTFPNLQSNGTNAFNWVVDLYDATYYTDNGEGGATANLNGKMILKVRSPQGILQPEFQNIQTGVPIPLFSFELSPDCTTGAVQLEQNDGPELTDIANRFGTNINNSATGTIGNNVNIDDLYGGNDANNFLFNCPVDDQPTPVDDDVETNANTPISIDVLTNDIIGQNGLAQNAILLGMQPVGGTFVVDDQGNNDPSDDEVVFTPTLDFTGVVTIEYNLQDPDGDTGEQPATISVTVLSPAVADLPLMPLWAMITMGATLLLIMVRSLSLMKF